MHGRYDDGRTGLCHMYDASTTSASRSQISTLRPPSSWHWAWRSRAGRSSRASSWTRSAAFPTPAPKSSCSNRPAGEGAALEVVDTEAGFEFAVVVFDPPADLRQPDEGLQSGTGGEAGQPVLDRLRLARRPFSDQPFNGQAAVVVAGDAAVGRADADGQEMRAHLGLAVAGGGAGAVPPGDLPHPVTAGGQDELFERARRVGVGGVGWPPAGRVGGGEWD